eukprot:3801558-Rhodomonas_salina.5
MEAFRRTLMWISMSFSMSGCPEITDWIGLRRTPSHPSRSRCARFWIHFVCCVLASRADIILTEGEHLIACR